MPDNPQPPRLLLLDLRSSKRAALPALTGLAVVNPNPCSGSGGCQEANTALAVLVAIDGEAAYTDWQQRFHPMCPSGFPHVVLLDPWDPALARRVEFAPFGVGEAVAFLPVVTLELGPDLVGGDAFAEPAAAAVFPPSGWSWLIHSMSSIMPKNRMVPSSLIKCMSA